VFLFSFFLGASTSQEQAAALVFAQLFFYIQVHCFSFSPVDNGFHTGWLFIFFFCFSSSGCKHLTVGGL